MTRKNFLFAFAVVVFLSTATGAQVSNKEVPSKEKVVAGAERGFEKFTKAYVAPAPGCAAAVSLNGELLFERAFGAVWQRAHVTLGDVTLAAITDRVLSVARESFPWVSQIQASPAGLEFEKVRQAGVLDGHKISRATELVLTNFLVLLGNLTAEILTPALHAELAKVQGKAQRDDPHEPTRHRARSKSSDQG